MKRAFTLLELMVVVAIIGILTTAITRAFVAGIDYQRTSQASRDAEGIEMRFEDRVKDLLQSAELSADATSTDSYFIGSNTANGATSANADTLQFTGHRARLPGALVTSQDDFETINQNLGPQGGVDEVQLSTTPVGDATGKSGLFLREQRPADGDPTQGGYESLLNANVSTIEFEFWDGQQWQAVWDTRTEPTAHLPAAVRVTFTLNGEAQNSPHVFVVRLPLSDVTAQNVAGQSSTAGGP